METVLGILAFVALFVAYGVFRPGARRGCGGNCGADCASDGHACSIPPCSDEPLPGTFGGKEV